MATAQLPPPFRPRAGNGRYEVGKLLGRGGMAEVFDGRSLGSHGFEKRVAIKRILPELAGDQTFTSRLVVEAKLAVALQHANIVQALDLVRDGHDVFLVMEFINGPTLRRLMQERYAAGAGPLPLGLSTYVLHEAAAGLDYAHTQPDGAVIHADISPSNLLISRAGEVKLADFGIARREGIARAAEGKWGYMAPEQERGEPLSPRADVYALGVVLYELLTGVHPFGSRAAHSPRTTEPLIAPLTVRPDLPRALSDLCCEMLAPEVSERPASAKEVMERVAELRYREGWRDGRSELASAVAPLVSEVDSPSRPASVPARVATEMTSHPLRSLEPLEPLPRNPTEQTNSPLTLVTRSLLIDRAGSPQLEPPSAWAVSTDPSVLSSDALATSAGGTAVASSAWAPAAPPRRRLPSMRSWIILGLAAAVGALWALSTVGGEGQTSPTAPPITSSSTPESTVAARAPSASAPIAPIAAPPAPPAPAPGALAGSPPGDAPDPGEARAAPHGAGEATTAAPGLRETDPGGTDEVPAAAPPAPPSRAPGPREPKERSIPRPRGESAKVEAADVGTLRVYAEPWAYVQVGEARLETPARLALRPGKYVVRLANPELGLTRTQTVRIRSKEMTTLKVRWNE